MQILALIVVLICSELLLRLSGDFGMVYPYHDYFYGKNMRQSIFKGEPWQAKEYTNLVIRDERLQHVRALPDLSQAQNLVFLLGDSTVESSSTTLEESFYMQAEKKLKNITLVPFHFAGCSLQALTIYLNNYQPFFTQNNKTECPSLR
jgi:hypothetical protein